MTRNYPTYARTLVLAPYSYAFTDANDLFFMTATKDATTYIHAYRGNDATSSNLIYEISGVTLDSISVASDGAGYSQAFIVSDGKVEVWEVFD